MYFLVRKMTWGCTQVAIAWYNHLTGSETCRKTSAAYAEESRADPFNDGPDISARGVYNVTLCTPSQLGFASDVAIRMGDILKSG